ncbi:MAG: GNAT family N-acetyltransferase [Pseudomonadota bacterium]
MTPTIRPAIAADTVALAAIAGETLFPADMLAPMIAPFLRAGTALWLTALRDGAPCGFAFAEPEALTDGTWNLRAIAALPSGQGTGRALLTAVEEALRAKGARIVVIDTTQTDDQAAARRLYASAGYAQVGHIADFFADGEDRMTFAKRLS